MTAFCASAGSTGCRLAALITLLLTLSACSTTRHRIETSLLHAEDAYRRAYTAGAATADVPAFEQAAARLTAAKAAFRHRRFTQAERLAKAAELLARIAATQAYNVHQRQRLEKLRSEVHSLDRRLATLSDDTDR